MHRRTRPDKTKSLTNNVGLQGDIDTYIIARDKKLGFLNSTDLRKTLEVSETYESTLQ